MAAHRASKAESNPTQIRLQKKRKISKFTILMISSPEIGVPVFREIKLNSTITRLNRHFLIIQGTARPLGQKQAKSTGPVVVLNFVILIQVAAAPGTGERKLSASAP